MIDNVKDKDEEETRFQPDDAPSTSFASNLLDLSSPQIKSHIKI